MSTQATNNEMENEAETVVVGGALPGTVRWRDDGTGAAVVHCHGHCDPIAVYEAACHDGADLDEITAERIVSGPDAGAWLVW